MTTAVAHRAAAGVEDHQTSPFFAMLAAQGRRFEINQALIERFPHPRIFYSIPLVLSQYYLHIPSTFRRYLVKKNLDGYVPVQQRAGSVTKVSSAPQRARGKPKQSSPTLTGTLKSKRGATKKCVTKTSAINSYTVLYQEESLAHIFLKSFLQARQCHVVPRFSRF